MMVARILSTAAAALVLSAASVQAQAGRVPAEVPPASYTQSQFVDSNGCVFIRAGSNGRVTWVPRYGDDRRPMCGFEPSLAQGAAQVAAAAPVATPAPAPVTVTAPATVRAAAPRVTVAAAPTGGVPYSVPPETSRPRAQAAAPQAQIYQAQAGGLDTRWSFYDQMGPSPCTHYSPHSQMYAVPSPTMPELPLRCGPQAQHPADALREQSPRGGVWEPWNGSPMPAPNNNVYMLPAPYAPRWPQPWLNGASHQPQPAPAPAAPRATVSTMGTTAALDARPASATRGQMTNGQYVQIGTFGVPANASSAISRLQSRGLPVAQGATTSGGRQLQVVLAGPFASQAELGAALNAARALGYSDAFVR